MPTPRTTVRREPKRAAYDRDTIDSILDEALVAHLGFVHEDQPYVIPTLHARIGDRVYIHGSAASRMLRRLSQDVAACLTVTLVDGVVLARSVFNHSINYRSVVVLGACWEVEGGDEKMRALHAFTDRLIPGRWDEVRQPSPKELKATRVLVMSLDECSAKLRSGPPGDDEPDYELPVWAGVVPLRTVADPPIPDPSLAAGIEPSGVIAGWSPSAARTR